MGTVLLILVLLLLLVALLLFSLAISQAENTSTTPAATATASSTSTVPAAASSQYEVLPIGAYREEILHRIERDRVTIIHGETGCGKSLAFLASYWSTPRRLDSTVRSPCPSHAE